MIAQVDLKIKRSLARAENGPIQGGRIDKEYFGQPEINQQQQDSLNQ